LALAIDMAKKHRAGRPQRASQRKKASKPTARALPKVRKKAKAIGKNAKPKAKRRAALAAKGGGNATAAGVTFQASVGAIFAVQMLTESFGDYRLGLPPFKMKILRFESDAPLDDIAIETDQNGWLLLQAKTALGLSTSLTSEFGKTVLQIVRQWHAGLQGSGRRGWDRPLSQDCADGYGPCGLDRRTRRRNARMVRQTEADRAVPKPEPEKLAAPHVTSPKTAAAPPWLAQATSYLGFQERGENRGIEEFIARAGCGTVGDPWCAIFVNACLETVGVRGTRSAMARSFA
jgi:hypothetical protein